MTVSWLSLALLAVAAAACLGIAIYAISNTSPPKDKGELLLNNRLAAFEKLPSSVFVDDVEVHKDDGGRWNPIAAARGQLRQAGRKRLDRSERGQSLVKTLALANLKLRPLEWLVLSGVAIFVFGVLFFLRFGQPVFFLLGAVVGYFACGWFLKFRTNRRRKRFDAQLSPTMMAISNGLKAGFSFPQTMDLVSKTSAEPMREELTRVVRETQLGRPIIDAMAKMTDRNDSEEMRLLLSAVQIQSQTGANLAKIVDRIEMTVRERIRIKGEIKTLTGQARASGWILIILPFALSGILAAIAPSYFNPMFTKTIGQIMLGVAGFMIACGYAVIQKIVNIRV